MDIKINKRSFFVFDLDDTLFQEIDFLKSAYAHISRKLAADIGADIYEEMWSKYKNKENVFQWIIDRYHHSIPQIKMEWLLNEYREHMPEIKLSSETLQFLKMLRERKVLLGLITDGRSVTQRNKLKSLGIENYFTDIIISEEFGSEKPDERNYLYFQNKYPDMDFYFFGDNTLKDFIVPDKLQWQTFCLQDQGNNIHLQYLQRPPIPNYLISSFGNIQLT